MTKMQKLLLKLLSTAIRRDNTIECYSKSSDRALPLNLLLEEARAHQIQALLYPIIKRLDGLSEKQNKLASVWKKEAILSGITQIQHIQQTMKVIEVFSKAGIPIIVLKGLTLRELYPWPELRTMNDADLLIHEDNIKSATELLLEMGYYQEESTPMHIRFEHKAYLTIELHRTIIDDRYIEAKKVSGMKSFEDELWRAAIPFKISGIPCKVLSIDDQVLHLCLHMATHIVSSGFGLRQLCDLVLLMEAKKNEINWKAVFDKAKMFGISKFAHAILLLCSRSFCMNMPDCTESSEAINDERYLKFFLNDIFCSGAYGKRNMAYSYGNELAYKSDDCLLSVLFPPFYKLSERYKYLRVSFLLSPFAYIHHIVKGILNQRYSFIDKFKFLFLTFYITKKRAKLLHWLNLIS